ncbi:MAG: DUF934 domain-containing protein [Pseudomonadota bacterium]
MPLLDDTGLIADRWIRLADDAAWPNTGDVIVDYARREDAPLDAAFGVEVGPDVDIDALIAEMDRFALIAVRFPKFADGRGFSIARRLRAAGFKARLRAVGPVISDQFDYLLACGFDEVAPAEDVAARQPSEHWLSGQSALSRRYQRGYGDAAAIPELRIGAEDDRLAA